MHHLCMKPRLLLGGRSNHWDVRARSDIAAHPSARAFSSLRMRCSHGVVSEICLRIIPLFGLLPEGARIR